MKETRSMWYQLQIESCPSEEVETVSNLLENSEALSITLTDQYDAPVLEPLPGTTPIWPEVMVQALFLEQKQAQTLQWYLAALYPQLTTKINQIANQDWETITQEHSKPQRFGKRLWVCPSRFPPPEPKACNILLDPGLAFGTGSHPTTNLCLSWLDGADLNQKKLIDYGAGSGILSIAALKLGAAFVYAVDIDPQALQATKNNALANGISEQELQVDYPSILQEPVDIILANILLGPLLVLKEDFHALLQKNGKLVISGIFNDQVESLLEAYQANFKLVETHSLEDWSLLVFT